MIIGLCGKKRVGKDTVADYLVEKYGFVKYSFGQPIKDVAKILFDFTDDQLYGDKKEIVDSRWGITPRQFFQGFGTDYIQYQLTNQFPTIKNCVPNRCFWVKRFWIWYNAELTKNPELKVVIADVRFKHEYTLLKSYKAYLIKIENPRIINLDTHISENGLNYLNDTDYNYVICNDDTLESLYSTVSNIIK